MARMMSFPFRLIGTDVATVEQNSEAAHSEQLAVLLLTIRGERPLVPTFGIGDPAFHRIEPSDVQLGVGTFGPPVTISQVNVTIVDSTTQEVLISYV